LNFPIDRDIFFMHYDIFDILRYFMPEVYILFTGSTLPK